MSTSHDGCIESLTKVIFFFTKIDLYNINLVWGAVAAADE